MNANLNSLSSKFLPVSIVKKTAIIIVTVFFTTGFSGMAVAQTVEDSASVSEFVEAYQHTINTRDPAALAAFFTYDADFVMFNLPKVRGRQAIENWWRDFWQSKFNRQEPERRGTFNLRSVRFLAADIALANIEVTTGGHDSLGAALQIRKTRGTWLLHRQNGNWFISAIRGIPTEEDSVNLAGSMATARLLRPDIRAFVYAYEDAFNSHNPSAVAAFFQNDADIIVRNKPLIQGKKDIRNWWQNYFSAPRPYKAVFIIDEIRTISDDVVQVNVIGTGAVPETMNKLQPVRQSNAMWILEHKDGQWLIAALRVLPGRDDHIIRKSDL